jgi:hypothetical protein
MKNSQKGFAPVLIILLVVVIGFVAFAMLYQQPKCEVKEPCGSEIQNNQQATSTPTATATTTKPTADSTKDWKTYTNTDIGFQFSYPKGFKNLKEYPQNNGAILEDRKVGKDMHIKAVTVATIDNLTVSYALGRLGDAYESGITLGYNFAPADATKKVFKVGDREAVEYDFVNATGYSWTITQISVDPNHYIEFAYTYGNSHRLNGDGYHLTGNEWENMLASFKLLSSSQ